MIEWVVEGRREGGRCIVHIHISIYIKYNICVLWYLEEKGDEWGFERRCGK